MEIKKLQTICNKVQGIFDKSEKVSIQISNHSRRDGDLDTFTLKTKCYCNREDRALVDEFGILCRQKNDRHVIFFPNTAAAGKAVGTGHHNVQNNKIGASFKKRA